MTTSHPAHHRVGDARFIVLLTAAHAAVAFPALGVWAALCDRARWARR